MARYVRLDDRAVLAVSGGDASGFLQGLVTNDMGRLAGGGAIHAALLTPQGKYLFDFLVFARDGAFCLDCEAEARPALARRLAIYKLRADVAIDAALPDPVFALFGEGAEAERIAGAEAFADPRHPRSARGWSAYRGRKRSAPPAPWRRRARNTTRSASRMAYPTGGATWCRRSRSCWRTASTSSTASISRRAAMSARRSRRG